jgi:hypothetical protein
MFMGGVREHFSLCRIVILGQIKDPVGDTLRVDPLATSVDLYSSLTTSKQVCKLFNQSLSLANVNTPSSSHWSIIMIRQSLTDTFGVKWSALHPLHI